MSPYLGCCFWTGREWSGARCHIVREEVDDESWCGLSADRTWRRYRGGHGVCPGGGRPGLRPYCDLRSCPRCCSCSREPKLTGPYRECDPFHEPLVTYAYLAGVTKKWDWQRA